MDAQRLVDSNIYAFSGCCCVFPATRRQLRYPLAIPLLEHSQGPTACKANVTTTGSCWPIRPFQHPAGKQPPVASKAFFGQPPGHDQISICSEISKASSTSIPRYRTVDSSLCPRRVPTIPRSSRRASHIKGGAMW